MDLSQALIVIFGPTSSGKTKLSLELAEKLEHHFGKKSAVISADSRQVYKFMDIGTSKIAREEMGKVPHEMIDVAEPTKKFELEEYLAMARRRVEWQRQHGRVPLVVGGTGVYVAGLLGDWQVEGGAKLRAELRRDYPPEDATGAYKLLQKVDRDTAKKVHPKNYELIISRLVSAMSTAEGERTTPDPSQVVFGLDPGPSTLSKKVAATIDNQMDRGLFDEVKSLAKRYNLNREMRERGKKSANQVLHTHGYREFFEVAAERGRRVADLSKADLDRIRGLIREHVYAYTRRQRSWFKKLPNVRSVRSADQVLKYLKS